MPGKLFAIADIHLSHKFNLDAFQAFLHSLPTHDEGSSKENSSNIEQVSTEAEPSRAPIHRPRDHRQDGLILAGDVSEKLAHLRLAFEQCSARFSKVWWVPGNHELYTLPSSSAGSVKHEDASKSGNLDADFDRSLKGADKYQECCRIAREYSVLTPEDEYVPWEYNSSMTGPGTTTATVLVCPIFTLYDYSFRPSSVSREDALDWAMENGTMATDEALLHPHPYASRDAWCSALLSRFSQKLAAAQSHKLPLVIINHWPLREDLIHIPLVPRFTLWCGSKATENWHRDFNARVVVTGHLHVRRTDWRDGCRFEEVSLGYPRQWEKLKEDNPNPTDGTRQGEAIARCMREVLPSQWAAEEASDEGLAHLKTLQPVWRGWTG